MHAMNSRVHICGSNSVKYAISVLQKPDVYIYCAVLRKLHKFIGWVLAHRTHSSAANASANMSSAVKTSKQTTLYDVLARI